MTPNQFEFGLSIVIETRVLPIGYAVAKAAVGSKASRVGFLIAMAA